MNRYFFLVIEISEKQKEEAGLCFVFDISVDHLQTRSRESLISKPKADNKE